MREQDIWQNAEHRRPRALEHDMKYGIGDFSERPINTPMAVPIIKNKDPNKMYFWCPVSANNSKNHPLQRTVSDWMSLGYEPVKSIEHPELSFLSPTDRETLSLIAEEVGFQDTSRSPLAKSERAFIYWLDCILLKCDLDLVNSRLNEIQRNRDKAVQLANPQGFNKTPNKYNMTMNMESPLLDMS